MEIELKLALHPRHIARIRCHPLLHEIQPEQCLLFSIYFDTRNLIIALFNIESRNIISRVLTSHPEWGMGNGNH